MPHSEYFYALLIGVASHIGSHVAQCTRLAVCLSDTFLHRTAGKRRAFQSTKLIEFFSVAICRVSDGALMCDGFVILNYVVWVWTNFHADLTLYKLYIIGTEANLTSAIIAAYMYWHVVQKLNIRKGQFGICWEESVSNFMSKSTWSLTWNNAWTYHPHFYEHNYDNYYNMMCHVTS